MPISDINMTLTGLASWQKSVAVDECRAKRQRCTSAAQVVGLFTPPPAALLAVNKRAGVCGCRQHAWQPLPRKKAQHVPATTARLRPIAFVVSDAPSQLISDRFVVTSQITSSCGVR